MTKPQFADLTEMLRNQRDANRAANAELLEMLQEQREADRTAHAKQLSTLDEIVRKLQALKGQDGRVAQ